MGEGQLYLTSVLVWNGMTFEGQMRELSDKFLLKLVRGGVGGIFLQNLAPLKISRYAPALNPIYEKKLL